MPFPYPDFGKNWLKELRRLIPLGDGWSKVFGFEPDAYPEITNSRVFAGFKGFLYAGTNHISGLQIWRSVDGENWQQCVGPKSKTPAGFGNASNKGADHMTILDDSLYVGTEVGVWFSQDGDSWKQVVGTELSNQGIDALASFDGYVYAVSGTTIWRGKGAVGWEVVVGDKLPAMVKAGFGDPDITDITSLAVFDGKLYAGAGLDNPLGTTGIAVWYTSDGKNWEQFQKVTSGLPRSLHVHAMATFSGYLYVGGYHVLLVFRTDGTSGTAGSWVDATDGIKTGGGNDGVWSMGTYKGNLYLGALGVQNGMILWETTDGKNWSPVDTKVVGVDKSCADALADFKGYLYMTTRRTYPGPRYPDEQKLEIWRYGPRWGWPIKYFKPLLAHKPFIRFPPPPVWMQSAKMWSGHVLAKIQDLIGKVKPLI